MELENQIIKSINNDNQKNFISNILSNTINNAIDVGLRTILPDLIENQVISVKDSLLKNGLKDGVKTAVDSTIDLGKSAIGIVTGNFENINQIQTVIGKGGIIESISSLIDIASNKAYELGYINKKTNNVIIKGKDILLNNISNSIKKELNEQVNITKELEKITKSWYESYNNRNFDGMQKEYDKIKKYREDVIPLENLINKIKRIESLHNLISNNGHNFNIKPLEKEIVNKLNK